MELETNWAVKYKLRTEVVDLKEAFSQESFNKLQ